MMARTLTTAVKTAVDSATGEYAYLLQLEFSGGTLYVTTAATDLSWNSQTWTALGGALTFETIRETTDLAGQSVKIIMDGVSQVAITAMLAENYIGRLGYLYLAHFASDGSIIADPVTLFTGYMNGDWSVKETITQQQSWAKVETVLQSPLVRFNQTRGIRANLTSHKTHYSTDTFMRHITALPDGDIGWGVYQPGLVSSSIEHILYEQGLI